MLSAGLTLPLALVAVYTLVVLCATGFYVIERGEFYLELGPATLLVPVALVMLVVFAIATALWFSPLAPRARDVRRFAAYVLGFWYFLTPVIYTVNDIPQSWQFLASLNPVTAPIEMVKNGLLGVGMYGIGLATYGSSLVVVAIGGALLFSFKERRDMARTTDGWRQHRPEKRALGGTHNERSSIRSTTRPRHAARCGHPNGDGRLLGPTGVGLIAQNADGTGVAGDHASGGLVVAGDLSVGTKPVRPWAERAARDAGDQNMAPRIGKAERLRILEADTRSVAVARQKADAAVGLDVRSRRLEANLDRYVVIGGDSGPPWSVLWRSGPWRHGRTLTR